MEKLKEIKMNIDEIKTKYTKENKRGVQVQVVIPGDIKLRLEILAVKNNLSMTEILRELIYDFLRENEEEIIND